jgi:hypothetical protein
MLCCRTGRAARREDEPNRGGTTIKLDELQHAVAVADPAAILVPARILRRVIKVDRGLHWLGSVHPAWYVIPGAALGGIVAGAELGRPPDAAWPSSAVLIERPEPEELAKADPGVILTQIWRRLFCARVEVELRPMFESGAIDASGLRARIESIGRTEFEGARDTLLRDGLLLPPVSDRAAYIVFASAFLELTYFEPSARSIIFPAIEGPDAVEALLARDLDAAGLLAGTRPAGASDPSASTVDHEEESETFDGADELALSARGRAGVGVRFRRLAARARAATERGNSVRAAILWMRAAIRLGPEAGEAERAAARAAIRRLAVRLQKALFVQKGEASLWVAALTPLLPRAALGFWSPERRLLHDLQNVCLDHEREVFRLEPIGWLFSLGRRPLKHALPQLREVSMSKHLRTASGRSRKVRLSREARARLDGLLRPAVHRTEAALRERMRPSIESTLETAGVRPANLPERVAYYKLVEELIDPIVSRGFTNLGDLRDAVSRGNLKARDLSGPAEFFRGDRLLRADRSLSEVLDGVHRRGEVYLRWLQRFSALAFGTPIGRFLTRYFALPFGGTFVLLKGLEEIDELTIARLTGHHAHLVNAESITLLGTLALGIINYVQLRRAFFASLRTIGWFFRVVLVDVPARLLNHPLMRRLLESAVARAASRFLIKPGLVTAPVWALVRSSGYTPMTVNAVGLSTFLAACLVFNTGAGRTLEEIAFELISRAWHGMIPGLFRIIVSAFARMLEWVERFLYAVDEWLRFREGQARGMLAVKAVLGLIWGVVAYAARIYVNLLIEPQINPVKHFPVVTVAAKIIFPFALTLTRIFAAPLTPFLGELIGNSIAATTVFFLPGVFGFLVWELHSNWKLYEANRPESLGPIAVGSHGETVLRFLRPGFHSGTLPKRFARLRRARRAGRDRAVLKHREALHHVEESVRRLVEREFAALLRESRELGDWSIEPGSIHLATNRIRVEILAGERDRPSLWIDLEERSGVLAAGVSQPGWAEGLSPDRRRTLADAVAGLYKISGVERIHKPGDPIADSCGVRGTDDGVGESGRPVNFADVIIPWHAWVAVWEGEAGEADWRARGLPEAEATLARRGPG